jgi:hypothetical protein
MSQPVTGATFDKCYANDKKSVCDELKTLMDKILKLRKND